MYRWYQRVEHWTVLLVVVLIGLSFLGRVWAQASLAVLGCVFFAFGVVMASNYRGITAAVRQEWLARYARFPSIVQALPNSASLPVRAWRVSGALAALFGLFLVVVIISSALSPN